MTQQTYESNWRERERERENKTDVLFLRPSAFRPFGASADIFLAGSQKRSCACAQRSSQTGQEDLSRLEASRQEFRYMFIGSKDSAMPGGPSFKFNSDHIRDLLPGRKWAGGGGYVERKSDVFSVRI